MSHLLYICPMSAHNEKPLEGAILEFLRYYGLEGKYNDMKVINAWKPVVGKMIANHTMDLYIQRKTLFVKLDSDALRNELSYNKSLLLLKLNEAAGKQIITDIVFR